MTTTFVCYSCSEPLTAPDEEILAFWQEIGEPAPGLCEDCDVWDELEQLVRRTWLDRLLDALLPWRT